MKVVVLNTMVPFLHGGAEELAVHLVRNLERFGHRAELVRLPFRWEPSTVLPEQILAARGLSIRGADRIIPLKFPAYLVPHEDKVPWLLHQYRQAYDLRARGITNILDDDEGDAIQQLIETADARAFRECTRIFTNSPVTTARLQEYNGVGSVVLPPPLNDPELFGGGDDEGYVLAAGRVNDLKRQTLLVEALRHAGPGVRLVIAGPPDDDATAERLGALVEREGVADRVRLELRFLERPELSALVNGARAVAYVPLDEDSLGYVAMEAAEAAKPVLTASDSGGILDLVRDGETGWVAEPDAAAVGQQLARIAADPAEAERRGRRAREVWRALGLTWESTIERLTE